MMLETMTPEFLEETDRVEWACWLARALVLGRSGDTEGALEVLGFVLRDIPRNASLYMTKAFVLTEAGRLEEAERSIASAVLLAPDDWEVHVQRGLLREQLGKLRQAKTSYRAAIRRSEDKIAEPFMRLGWLCKRVGQNDEAIEAFEKYLALSPNDPFEWVSLAILYSNQGRGTDAEICYQRSLAIEPGFAHALFNRAISAHKSGDTEMLSECVDTLLTGASDDRRALWAQGILLSAAGEDSQAIKVLGRVFQRCLGVPDLGSTELGSLGHWLFPLMRKQDKEKEAWDLVSEALSAFVFDPSLLRTYVSYFGVESESVSRFILSVDAADPDVMPDENGIPRCWRYRRRYEVLAENADEAWQRVFELEALVGGEELRRGELASEQKIEGLARRGVVGISDGNAYLEDFSGDF